jgi:hypothetical protein
VSTTGEAGYARAVSLPMSGATPEMLARLVEAMRGQVVDGVRIHDARASTGVLYGEPVVRVRLLIDDPPPGERTWPVDTMHALRRLAGDVAWYQIGNPDLVLTSRVALSKAEQGGFQIPTRGA